MSDPAVRAANDALVALGPRLANGDWSSFARIAVEAARPIIETEVWAKVQRDFHRGAAANGDDRPVRPIIAREVLTAAAAAALALPDSQAGMRRKDVAQWLRGLAASIVDAPSDA